MSKPTQTPQMSTFLTCREQGLLPAEIIPLLRDKMPSLVQEMTRAIRAKLPPFADAPDEWACRDRRIRDGLDQALKEFVDSMAGTDDVTADYGGAAELHRELGRTEMREGRTLVTMQSAYRFGVRFAWRRCTELGQLDAIMPPDMHQLVSGLMNYIDELAEHTAAGYAQEQARLSGSISRHRPQLLEFLVAPQPTPRPAAGELARLARSADWKLPGSVQSVALQPFPEQNPRRPLHPQLVVVAGMDALSCSVDAQPHILLPDPGPDTRARLGRALAGRNAAVGPEVPPSSAAMSLALARRLLSLIDQGLIDAGPVAYCSDHLLSLLLLQNEVLLLDLTAQRMAPLKHLPDSQRDCMTRTLLAWLDGEGSAAATHRVLTAHPQTIRGRLRQTKRVLGPCLRDPATRFELEVMLRTEALRVAALEREMPSPRHGP